MPIKKEILKKHFGNQYEELIDNLNETLRVVGQEIICIDDRYAIQFDLHRARNDPSIALLLLLYTDKSSFNKDEETGDFILSPLTNPELAIVSAVMALWQKHGRPKAPLKELRKATENALDKRLFNKSLNKLISLKYLIENEGIISPGWRFKAEIEEPLY
ncbi:MAG: hypothetical protein HWN66_06140 [Candidatus Helarchaeota archaeon]|nr:hypothetical protein [Candidatus Helarchaeota archaeon]